MKNRRIIRAGLLVGLLAFIYSCNAQSFDEKLNSIYRNTVPSLKVKQLDQWKGSKIHYLDTREKKEYKVSHIQKALHVGYNHFQMSRLKGISKSDTIVLYCSVGYRSERIGEKLLKAGYKNVYNLYGGIFGWIHEGKLVYHSGLPVSSVHVYNKKWGQWLQDSTIKKVYK